MADLLQGGCYCGAVRYECRDKPSLRAQCHCRACQHIAGGGPNYFMLVAPEGFEYFAGTPKQFTRPDLESPVTRDFCGTCGTHILTRRQDMDQLVLKAGTLDDPTLFKEPRIAIFCEDMQSFHTIKEGVPMFEKLPDTQSNGEKK